MRNWKIRALLIGLLLLAAALRFYRLDAQSFWNDEGNSARIAERPLRLILEGAAGDIHPPGYYILLHFWRFLAGQSEFALRAPSAWAGIVLVALTYRLGRRLFGESAGLGATLLSACSPFAIYYSQEARMYALLAALTAAALLFLLRLLDTFESLRDAEITSTTFRQQWSIGLGYVLICAAGLYTQYVFTLVLLVHNIIFVLWWLAHFRKQIRHWPWFSAWISVQCAIAALYLPWLPNAVRSVQGWSGAELSYQLGPALLDVLRVLSAGITVPLEEATPPVAAFTLFSALGLWPRHRQAKEWVTLSAYATSAFLPIGLMFTLRLYKPAWLKFLLVALPAFQVLVAQGVNRVGHWMTKGLHRIHLNWPSAIPQAIVLCSLFMLTTSSLNNLYFDPRYARDNYRQIAHDLAAGWRDGNCVILNAPNQWEVFTYYFEATDVYPAPYRPTPEKAEAFLKPLLIHCRQLYVLYWGDAESDPTRLIESRLAEQAYLASERWYGNVRLAIYGIAPLPITPSQTSGARFGNILRLDGYAVVGDHFIQGEILPVTLFWRADSALAERYKVTIQLLDQTGRLVTQHDGEPVGGLSLTSTWLAGVQVIDRHGILLPPDLPAGTYTLIVGVYHLVTAKRLPVTAEGWQSDYLPLDTIRFGL